MLDERDKRIAELEAELEVYKKRCEQLSENCEKLQCQLNELLRHRFGKKSERFVEDPSESKEEDSAAHKDDSEEDEWVLYRRRKKAENHKELPRRIVVIP